MHVVLVYHKAGGAHEVAANAIIEWLDSFDDVVVEKRELFSEIINLRFISTFCQRGVSIYNWCARRKHLSNLLCAAAIFIFIIFQKIMGNLIRSAATRTFLELPDVKVVSLIPLVNDLLSRAADDAGISFSVWMLEFHEIFKEVWFSGREKLRLASNVSRQGGHVAAHKRDVIPTPLVVRRRFVALSRRSKRNGFVIVVAFGRTGNKRAWSYATKIATSLPGTEVRILGGLRCDSFAVGDSVIEVLDVREDVASIMSEGHLFVGKPGAMFISECLALRLPMLLELNFDTFFQERQNAVLVRNNGFGETFRNGHDLCLKVSRLRYEENRKKFVTSMEQVSFMSGEKLREIFAAL